MDLEQPLVLASWGRRGVAFVIDFVPVSYLAMVLALRDVPADGQQGGPGSGFLIAMLMSIAWIGGNLCYLQGRTGQSLGKRPLGIAVHVAGTSRPMGVPTAIRRYFTRFLDIGPCYLGLLWPLWDAERRTFSDMICGTRVHRIGRQPRAPD